ncbi:hypothetical protein GE107_02260 [Cohnella sp. CFH 77786]|uniref:hypothetical protein n=1 Tax=Cohnella sp. CFH 77786 TaxID=2662265 RepID=UPI001C610879|nr:hypothetical protein [Cohnella sp. CFH 77786]MBW5444887.1 hypothetical protein [Cohnella sp. CFH 77786]
MEELISFLLKNFYIVIIIVGLIYTMFIRKSPLEKPPANRPASRPGNRMPDFGGSPMFPPKPRSEDGRPADRRGAQPVERREPRSVERTDPRPEFREAGRPGESKETRPDYRVGRPVEYGDPQPEYGAPSRKSENTNPQPEYGEPARPIHRLPAAESDSSAAAGKPSRQGTAAAGLASTAGLAAVPSPALTVIDEGSDVLTREDLTRAIVWAEILGPPRSRRPFRKV